MKTTGKNNPVQVGALLGILGATLFFLMKQMGGSNTPAATLTPVADAPVADAPKVAASGVTQDAQRDPFDHPALRRIAKIGLLAQNQTPEAQATPEATPQKTPGGKPPISPEGQTLPLLSILPDRTSVHNAPKTRPAAPTLPGAGNAKPAGSTGSPVPQEADDPLKGWRLTAVIAGRSPRAVIEGVGTGPTLVGVGGRVRRLNVTAIQEREIVLQDAYHLYTLPLQSAPAAPENGSGENAAGDTRNNSSASADGKAETQITGRSAQQTQDIINDSIRAAGSGSSADSERALVIAASRLANPASAASKTNTTRENAHGTVKTNP